MKMYMTDRIRAANCKFSLQCKEPLKVRKSRTPEKNYEDVFQAYAFLQTGPAGVPGFLTHGLGCGA